MSEIKNNTDKELALLGAQINRADLVALLSRAGNYALTLLLAPAGSGKSTLMMQWRDAHPELMSAAIYLDERDAEPSHFLKRLNGALCDVVSRHVGPTDNDLGVAHSSVFAERLANALSLIEAPMYILIDDFHFADNLFIQGMFAELMTRLPRNIHFIVASHTHPQFSLSRLKLHGRAQVIDHYDLRFSESELLELSKRLCPSISEERRRQLLTATEGCAAGVKLGLIAMSESATVGEAALVVRAWQSRHNRDLATGPRSLRAEHGIDGLNGVEALEGGNAAIERLTLREKDILDLLRTGISNKEISQQSGVAVTTIKWHIKNIFGKLKVSSRAEAIVMANREPERFGFNAKIEHDQLLK